MKETYKFQLYFKGLCMCVPQVDPESGQVGMTVLLPDARAGKVSPTTGDPLREHQSLIEFRIRDWRNRTDVFIPSFVEVSKPDKGRVGLYILSGQDVKIEAMPGELRPGLVFDNRDGKRSLGRLPQLSTISRRAKVRSSALTKGKGCNARIRLNKGIVTSFRQSTFSGNPVNWAYSRPHSLKRLRKGQLTKQELAILAADLKRSGPINLDVRVTMKVPVASSVVIDANPLNGLAVDPPAFVLRPPKGKKKLEVWIKNRELDVALLESDVETREFGCDPKIRLDSDFEIFYDLVSAKAERKVPYREDDGGVSVGGCACGCIVGGSVV